MSQIAPKNNLEPAWQIATLFPNQGAWAEEDYLELETNRLVEFVDGFVEVQPTPTELHQLILLFLLDSLRAHIASRNIGKVMFAPLRLRLRNGLIREPDILFVLDANKGRTQNEFWEWADLVMEIVSPDGHERDHVRKRRDYASAGIPEYWIIDPQEKEIIVLKLQDTIYIEHGRFSPGQRASSALLNNFIVDVTAVFAFSDTL